jgi:chromosome segregation ATPase
MNMDDNLNKSLELEFRAEQMKTVLENRIGFLRNLKCTTKEELYSYNERIRIYEDCLNILQKEFFDLRYHDNFVEEEIKKYRDEIIEKVNPIKQYRGTSEYMKQLRLNGRFADMLEGIMVRMYNLGRNTRKNNDI